jgi:Holliday junction resolvasome RuvABC DNA-binding subunit
MSYAYETCEGHIGGLYLPLIAWKVLHRENIRTVGRLREVAGRLERFEGIGSKTAQAIRLELNRVARAGEPTYDDGQLSAWGA